MCITICFSHDLIAVDHIRYIALLYRDRQLISFIAPPNTHTWAHLGEWTRYTWAHLGEYQTGEELQITCKPDLCNVENCMINVAIHILSKKIPNFRL